MAALRENDTFMERHNGDEKKGNSEALFGEGFRGELRRRVIKLGKVSREK